MRLTKRPPPAPPGMDITPMIDVVFQLLIFFMTVSQITESKRAQLDLPDVGATLEQTHAALIVNLDAAGRIDVGAVSMTLDGFRGLLQNELTQTSAELINVVIRADRHCQSQTVNELVALLGQQGVKQVRIAVTQPR